MSSYYLKCGKNQEKIYPTVSKPNKGKTMVLSKCAICGCKQLSFIKNKKQVKY